MHNRSAALGKKFWLSFVLALVFIFIMRWLTIPLTSREIVDFELAKSVGKAAQLREAWEEAGLIPLFLRSIYLDFGFIIAYTAAFYFGSGYFSNLSGNYILRKAGRGFSWLALVAGLCDVVENISMMYTVRTINIKGWITELTYDMAVIKFSLLLIVLLFTVACLFIWGIERMISARGYSR